MAEKAGKKEPLWKASQQNKDDRRKFFTIFISLIIIVIIIIAAFIATLPPVKKTIYSDLRLDGIQVRRLNDEFVDENTTSTDLEVVIYLTNDGELDSGNVKIDAYIKSFDSRGVETPSNSNDTITMGAVTTDSTSKTTLNFNDLQIKDDHKYTIDFYIWEDDKIVEKADTTIKVQYVEVVPEPPVASGDAEDEPGKSEEKEEGLGMPGFEIVPLLVAIVVILYVVRNRHHKEK